MRPFCCFFFLHSPELPACAHQSLSLGLAGRISFAAAQAAELRYQGVWLFLRSLWSYLGGLRSCSGAQQYLTRWCPGSCCQRDGLCATLLHRVQSLTRIKEKFCFSLDICAGTLMDKDNSWRCCSKRPTRVLIKQKKPTTVKL